MYTWNKSYSNTKKIKTFTVQECSVSAPPPTVCVYPGRTANSAELTLLNRVSFWIFLCCFPLSRCSLFLTQLFFKKCSKSVCGWSSVGAANVQPQKIIIEAFNGCFRIFDCGTREQPTCNNLASLLFFFNFSLGNWQRGTSCQHQRK